MVTDPYSANYNYSSPNINAQNIPGQTVNGVSGVGGYNFPNYTGIANDQNANSQNFNKSQYGTIGAFQGANQAAVNALPTFQQLNQQANNQYNVPGLTQTATDLNNTVLQIPRTYSQATQGSDTNNNQLMQLIGQKQWELDPLAQAATNSAQNAQQLANTSVGYGVQNEAQQLSPFANAAPLVNSQLAAAASNFTQDQANQLQALEAAVSAGTQLSGTQMAQLTSLQNAKTAYDQAVKVAQTTGQYALQQQQLANQYQNVPAGNTLVNTGWNTSQGGSPYYRAA